MKLKISVNEQKRAMYRSAGVKVGKMYKIHVVDWREMQSCREQPCNQWRVNVRALWANERHSDDRSVSERERVYELMKGTVMIGPSYVDTGWRRSGRHSSSFLRSCSACDNLPLSRACSLCSASKTFSFSVIFTRVSRMLSQISCCSFFILITINQSTAMCASVRQTQSVLCYCLW